MKKLFCFILALFFVVCIGCDTIDNTSSIIEQLNDIVKETETEVPTEESTAESIEEVTSQPTPSTVSSEPPVSSQAPTQIEEVKEKYEFKVIEHEPFAFKGEKPYSRSYITEEQQRIYDILNTALNDMISGIVDLQIEKSKDDATNIANDVNVAFRAVSFDNPEYFWLPSAYKLLHFGDKIGIAFSLAEGEHNFNFYPIKKSERSTMKKKLDEKVNELTDKVKGMGAFEAEEYFHDYLCNKVTYFNTDTPENYPLIFTTYGALVNGSAVCEGYSRAMQLLCDNIEIPCGLVYGWSQGEGHMWNLINLGNEWYHLDVTWDDDEQNGVISHRYFNVTQYDITYNTSHIIAEDFKKNQQYEDLDVYNFLNTSHHNKTYNYFEWLGYVVTTDYNVAGALAKRFIDNGATYFEIKNNSLDSNQNIVSYIIGELNCAASYYETYDVITIVL